MGTNELEGSREMGPVVPPSAEEGREAAVRMAGAAERWRRGGRYNRARAAFHLETVLLAAGIKEQPSAEWSLRDRMQRVGKKTQYGEK